MAARKPIQSGDWGYAGAPAMEYQGDTWETVGPQSFMRDGIEYSRGYTPFNGANEWANQYLIRDDQWGSGFPVHMIPMLTPASNESFIDKYGPAISGAFAGLPVAASINSLGGLMNSLNLPVGDATSLLGSSGGSSVGNLASAIGDGGGEALDVAGDFNGGAVGDPFIDAYTPIGTGGGPTGLPLPGGGAVGDPFIDAYTPIGTGGGPTGLPLPGGAGLGTSAAGALSKLLGGSVSPETIGLLGTGLSTLLGAYGSKSLTGDLKDIANQSRNDRLPALNAFNNALTNPNSWYESAPAMGAVDSVLRKLSAGHGNPALSPGAVSQAAAYNLGGYNDYLGKVGSLGLSGQAATQQAQTNAAMSNNNFYNALGSGLAGLTNNQPNLNGLLAQYLAKGLT